MKTYLTLKNIFIHSELNNKSFNTSFGDKLNVIYGANTSGKSTLIQLILFTFGINDNKTKLSKILSENIFSRLDIEVKTGNNIKRYVFIRKDESLYVKDVISNKIEVYYGISGNNSVEHFKLKEFINSLFDFDLLLETKNGISKAPIETIFLPYYVSQDVGWVYLRKSFSNLEFYKNFKDDYLDYYLGITKLENKEGRKKLENELSIKKHKYSFYLNFEKSDIEIEKSKLIDDSFKGKGQEFIDDIANKKSELLNFESKYIKLSNTLTYNNQRLSVLSKVSRNHCHQFPGKDNCPICQQTLPINTKQIYEYYQEANDSIKVKSEILANNKKIQSDINSTNKRIGELRSELEDIYHKHIIYSNCNITLDEWIKNQANIKLESSINENVGKLAKEISELKEKLKEFKNDDDIETERLIKSKKFKEYYNLNNIQLDVPRLVDNRFNYIYEISSFPFQGVELHLAVLSYHFAFNKIINETDNIHRLPLILDSIFKEDLDGNNKEKILEFIFDNKPNDTQTIISVADNKEKDTKIEYYKDKFFDNATKLIVIGNSINKESILSNHDNSLDTILNDSFEIMEYI
ncbi:ATP-binding protein [Sphingobacterium mizutaii]|uniref:ATP-binding protein n=1 Tax=Sphingobacterium mizutaii TaxID=1010 RepID=UPI001623C66F|nr:ATP-binding protein [Sphingobacterium mizutaii]